MKRGLGFKELKDIFVTCTDLGKSLNQGLGML